MIYFLKKKEPNLIILSALQLLHMDLECTISKESAVKKTNYMQFLSDSLIAKISTAIFISTIAMVIAPLLAIEYFNKIANLIFITLESILSISFSLSLCLFTISVYLGTVFANMADGKS